MSRTSEPSEQQVEESGTQLEPEEVLAQLPLSEEARQYWFENQLLWQLFSAGDIKRRAKFLERDLTLKDMREIFLTEDPDFPKDAECQGPWHDGDRKMRSFKAAVIDQNNGDLILFKGGDGEPLYRGAAIVLWDKKDLYVVETYCRKCMDSVRRETACDDRNTGKRRTLPVQCYVQAKKRAEYLNGRIREGLQEKDRRTEAWRERRGVGQQGRYPIRIPRSFFRS